MSPVTTPHHIEQPASMNQPMQTANVASLKLRIAELNDIGYIEDNPEFWNMMNQVFLFSSSADKVAFYGGRDFDSNKPGKTNQEYKISGIKIPAGTKFTSNTRRSGTKSTGGSNLASEIYVEISDIMFDGVEKTAIDEDLARQIIDYLGQKDIDLTVKQIKSINSQVHVRHIFGSGHGYQTKSSGTVHASESNDLWEVTTKNTVFTDKGNFTYHVRQYFKGLTPKTFSVDMFKGNSNQVGVALNIEKDRVWWEQLQERIETENKLNQQKDSQHVNRIIQSSLIPIDTAGTSSNSNVIAALTHPEDASKQTIIKFGQGLPQNGLTYVRDIVCSNSHLSDIPGLFKKIPSTIQGSVLQDKWSGMGNFPGKNHTLQPYIYQTTKGNLELFIDLETGEAYFLRGAVYSLTQKQIGYITHNTIQHIILGEEKSLKEREYLYSQITRNFGISKTVLDGDPVSLFGEIIQKGFTFGYSKEFNTNSMNEARHPQLTQERIFRIRNAQGNWTILGIQHGEHRITIQHNSNYQWSIKTAEGKVIEVDAQGQSGKRLLNTLLNHISTQLKEFKKIYTNSQGATYRDF